MPRSHWVTILSRKVSQADPGWARRSEPTPPCCKSPRKLRHLAAAAGIALRCRGHPLGRCGRGREFRRDPTRSRAPRSNCAPLPAYEQSVLRGATIVTEAHARIIRRNVFHNMKCDPPNLGWQRQSRANTPVLRRRAPDGWHTPLGRAAGRGNIPVEGGNFRAKRLVDLSWLPEARRSFEHPDLHRSAPDRNRPSPRHDSAR